MSKTVFETPEMELLIQRSLLARIKAAGNVYKSACASSGSLASYLCALESLAEYVATRCRGSELFQEIQPAGQQPIKARRRRPKLIPFTAPEAAPAYAAANRDLSCESLAG